MRAAHNLPLSQLESMTLSYVPLFVVTSFFWWAKPEDVLTPSVVGLPDMSTEQKATFENMSVDSTFDDEHTKRQDSWWNIWKLTPRVSEKEAKDKALEEMAQHTISEANGEDKSKSQNAVTPSRPEVAIPPRKALLKKAITENLSIKRTITEVQPSFRRAFTEKPHTDESQNTTIQITDISYEPTFLENALRRVTASPRTTRTTGLAKERPYPPSLPLRNRPRILGPAGLPLQNLAHYVSFRRVFLSWNTVFPTLVEAWLWRAAAITSIVSMLIFMQHENVNATCTPSAGDNPIVYVCLSAPTGSLEIPGAIRISGHAWRILITT
jgi:hypothetical protein